MNKFIKILVFLVICLSSTSCATLIGGRTYSARVVVASRQNTDIYYKGQLKGTNDATFEVERKAANRLNIVLQHEGCETQVKTFRQRTFRGWAFVGTIFTWTGLLNGIPIPLGLGVDLANGSLWKPDLKEEGVYKKNYDRYIYRVEYTGCDGMSVKNQN